MTDHTATTPLGAPRYRVSLRNRLTLLYGAAFTVAAIVILASVYFVVDGSLRHAPGISSTGMVYVGPNPDLFMHLVPRGTSTQPPAAGSLKPVATVTVSSVLKATKDNTLRNLLLATSAILAATILAASIGGRRLARYALSPLRHVTSTAAAIAHDGHLKTRINLLGARDEVTELADTFDHMLDRLDESFEAQRRFIGHVSHELRTPLAIERALLQVTPYPQTREELIEVRDQLLSLNRRTTSMVEDLLALAIGEQPVAQGEPVDLAALTSTVAEHCAPEATARGSHLTLDVAPTIVAGSEVLLERALVNLMRNAITHSPPGSEIRVSLTTSAADRLAQLTVTNPGPILDEATLERIAEPFERATDESDGTGLGLAIVRAIVANHEGNLALTSPPGGGLRAEINLRASDHT